MTEGTTSRKATIACPFCGRLNRVDMARASHRPKCGECGKPLLLDRPLRATDETLERMVADAGVPVLVDFYADWCAPCKMMAPILDEIAHDRTGDALVLKLDTDRNPKSAAKYGIQGIPTFIVFRDGKEVKRQVGGAPKRALEELLNV